MPNNETLGASFSIDITALKAGLAQANRMIRESESEFKAAAAGMDDWSKSQDGLEAKISSLTKVTQLQQAKVDALGEEYINLIKNGLDPTSKQAVELRTKINNETAALNKNKAELEKQTKALEELGDESSDAADEVEDLGEESKDAGKSLEAMGGIGKAAAGAIAAVAGACVAAVGAFLGLSKSTREARTNMAKLETGFTEAGFSAEDATDTYKELYSVLGDEDKATEASAHLAQLTNNQKELEEWTNICAGVYATFGDSLPIEGLTEASNETAKTGKLTGVLADALNWAGVSEDEFQAALDACTTEQERQAYITETLNGLYSDSAKAYKENNKEVIAAQRAQAELNETLAELGAIAEPIMTTLKELINDLLKELKPFVKLIGEGLSGALEGATYAADKLAGGLSGIIETIIQKVVDLLPFVVDTIVSIVPKVLNSLVMQLPKILSTLVLMVNKAIEALTEMIPQIVSSIVAVIPQLAQALVDGIPQITEAAIELLLSIIDAVPVLIEALLGCVPDLLEAAVTFFTALIDAIPIIIEKLLLALPDIIGTILTTLLESVPVLLEGAVTMLYAIIDAIPQIVTSLAENLPKIIEKIVGFLTDPETLKQIFDAAITLFTELVKAIPDIAVALLEAIPQIIGAIVEGLMDALGLGKIYDAGVEYAKNLWNGFKDGVGSLFGDLGGLILGGLGSATGFGGIFGAADRISDLIGGGGDGGRSGSIGGDGTGSARSVGDAGAKQGSVVINQTNNYSQPHTRYELYKSRQDIAAAVRSAQYSTN